MAETRQIAFKHTEIVEMMLKKQDIHEGIWGLFVKFGLQATNVGADDRSLMPAAIVPLLEIGLQRFEKLNNLSVDAAQVNPAPVASSSLKPA
jgi:hypothetical protein